MSVNLTFTCLILYRAKSSHADIVAWHRYVKDWLEEIGCPVHRLGVTAPGFDDEHAYCAATAERKLAKRAFAGLQGLDCISMQPDSKNIAKSCQADVYITNGNDWPEVFVGADSQRWPFAVENILQVVRALNDVCDFTYGIALTWKLWHGPVLYASGHHFDDYVDPLSADELTRLEQWNQDYIGDQTYLKGRLRDVYRVNILSHVHLDYPVFGKQSLGQWISESPVRGRLHAVSQQHTAWIVESDQINRLRSQLTPTGILISTGERDDTGT